MDKNYKTIDFMLGSNVEDAVNELIKYRDKGILACGSFNGTALYSDTVTMDSAYIEITGKTKTEFYKSQQEWKENIEKKEAEHKNNIPELTESWINKGREVLTEDKWKYWDKIVPIRLNDLYHGMELGCCLDIIKILNNNGSLDEVKKEIESQDHSGMSFGLVCTMIKELADRGQEFYEYVK